MTIKVLSRETAEKIAAGEVIERPVSVVKELLDNAVDAGASRIGIEILCGGKEYIKVTDNGLGINFTELPTAFLRHATSKITTIDDFETLASLGFRGEALPSIAAISKIKLISKPREQLVAGEILFNGGEQEYYQEIAARDGTTVIIENLFFNTPARLKFLKSDAHEASLIAELVAEYALGNSHIAFEFISQGKKLLHTTGKGNVREAIAEVWGKQIGTALIKEDFTHNSIKLEGYFSSFELSRSNRKNQIFFVNGRLVKNPIMHTALETPYRGVLPHRKYPLALVYISVPPGETDVNVHPAKTLIKFHDDRSIFTVIRSAVNNALRMPNMVTIDVPNKIDTLDTPKHTQQSFSSIAENIKISPYQQFKSALPFLREETHTEEAPINEAPIKETHTKLFPRLKFLGIYKNSYIIAQSEHSLCLIDQHAAHERVLFENILNKLEKQQQYSQLLLEPIVVDLPLNISLISEEILITLKNLGFDISYFGDKSYIFRSVPNYFSKGDLSETLLELINEIAQNKNLPKGEILAAKLACKAAVKLNDLLTSAEVEKLLFDLSACEEPFRCPHGRPTIVELENSQIEKWFKRIL